MRDQCRRINTLIKKATIENGALSDTLSDTLNNKLSNKLSNMLSLVEKLGIIGIKSKL